MMRSGISGKLALALLICSVCWTAAGAPITTDEWCGLPSRVCVAVHQLPARAVHVLRCWLALPASRALADAVTLPRQGMLVSVWEHDRDTAVQMPLETYVLGVVAAEMPASYHPEALKSQAIAARTRAAWSCLALGGSGCPKHPVCDICTDSACCQGYLTLSDMQTKWGDDAGRWLARIDKAVEDTAGEILTYDGLPIEIMYHACSGGQTEDAAAVFQQSVPYLKSVSSPGEESFRLYQTEVIYSRSDAAAMLCAAFPEAEITAENLPGSLELLSSTPSGRVSKTRIGSVTASGNELRKALGLNSALFTWDADDETITFHVRGSGHGVGMSQAGAQAMAAQGKTCAQILSHYYPGTVLTVLPD